MTSTHCPPLPNCAARILVPRADNDTKVASLDALKERLRAYGSSSSNNGDDEGGPGEVTTPVLSSVVEQLKVALKSSNARVSASALACTDAFFHALGTLTDAAAAPLLKTAVGALLPAPGVMAYLGDSKEATRSLAGSAVLQAGKAAAAADQSASGESTLNALDALVKEHGFGSKNARAREQVRLRRRPVPRLAILSRILCFAEPPLPRSHASGCARSASPPLGATAGSHPRRLGRHSP